MEESGVEVERPVENDEVENLEDPPKKTMDDYAGMDDKEILNELGITDITEEEFTDFLKDVDVSGGLVTREELTAPRSSNKKFLREKVQKWLNLKRKLGRKTRVPQEEREGLVKGAPDSAVDGMDEEGPSQVLDMVTAKAPTFLDYLMLLVAFLVSVVVGMFFGYGLRMYFMI